MSRPLSIAEQAMLHAERMRPGILSERATLTIALEVTGPLDLERLADAYDQLVSRHELLRTRLVLGTSRHDLDRVEVLPHRRCVPERVDLPDSALFARWDTLRVDPHAPPLLRCEVARRGPDLHIIGIVLSHVIADTTALRVVASELAALYGATEPLPPPISYAAYVEWEAERSAQTLERDREAWRRKLSGCRPARYARQVRFVVGQKPAPRFLRLPLFDRRESELLARWSTRNRSTLSITLLAAFARAIRDDADRDDLVVSTAFERRDPPMAKQMIGNFLRATPVRLSVSEREPMSALVMRAREVVLEAHRHANLPPLEFLAMMPRFGPGVMGLEPTWLRFFQYLPPAPASYHFGAAHARVVHLGGGGDPDDLLGFHLGVFHADDGSLAARMNYDSRELDQENALRVVEDFRHYALEAAQ